MELNEQGEGKCSVPMWSMGGPAGFCDEPAYGKPPPSKMYRNGWTGEMMRMDGRYNGYVPGLACYGHGGPEFRTFIDGNEWCAVRRDFINLQESRAGFGASREAAIVALTTSNPEGPPK
jgi:hypothetical protein